MKKSVLIILALLIALPFAMAKGGSSGYMGTPIGEMTEKPQCEDGLTIRHRIACRLENKPGRSVTPEACRLIKEKRAECIEFYKEIWPCYKDVGRSRDKCLKGKAGITVAKIENVKNPDKVRWHLISLLYSLEEHVETAYDNGTLEAWPAAELVGDIQLVKKEVLIGKDKATLKVKMKSLKRKYEAKLA